jgi:hypothetical protein
LAGFIQTFMVFRFSQQLYVCYKVAMKKHLLFKKIT